MKRFLSVLVAAVACAMNVAATAQASTADISITNDDGVSAVMPGGSVSYTITASNAGPDDALGSTVADTFPASLTCSWSCVGTGAGTCSASGYGNINDKVDLPSGASVTYTASCNISAAATGSLSNSALVIVPGGLTDPTPGNNSATDIDAFSANLGITNTDGATTAIPGGSPVVYTITASNAGPGDAPGSTVADTFPAGLTCNWTCVGAGGGTCTASSSGNINNLVNLPVGGSVTYTASCTMPSSATGSLINTATVATAGAVSDPVPGNNSATDTDTLTPQVNLSITNTDNTTAPLAGKTVTYTIRASNQNGGPSDAPGSIVTDVFPAPLVCTWTCTGSSGATCTASGSGNINDTVNLPKNGRVSYSATCALPASTAPGSSLNNTATVATAAGITETTPADNTLSDIDTVVGQPDLSATVTDGVTTVNPGDNVTYTMTVANGGSQGPSNAPGSSIVDTFPSPMACTWTCSGANGATCAASGSGNINQKVDLPSGSSVTYIAHCTVSASATGTLVNVITATPAAGLVEQITGNNSATDSDVVNVSANIALTVTDNRDFAQVGSVVDYVIDVTNPSGPAPAIAEVIDVLPPELDNGSWTCTPSGGATCNSGVGNTLVDIVTIPAGGKVEYVYSAVVKSTPTDDQIVNTASASLISGTDAATADNSATDNDIVAIFRDSFDDSQVVVANVNSAGAGHVSAQLQVDNGLLHQVGVVPVDIANGRSADGRRLFTLQIARFGHDVTLRTLTTDASGMNEISEWQTVDLDRHVLELAWQSASAQHDDGYFAVAGGGTPVLIDGRTIPDQLSYLQITIENNVPWLTLIGQ
jgi:uncharacterized repeat protein (TIGR01451 family)